jgi:hypothetical protein
VQPLSPAALGHALPDDAARTNPQERVKALRARHIGAQLRSLV